ncbi:MAG: alpha/beta hydrolase [candidate division KSB1 bacterium]|nr:alpha/beta hydrolase [candidate division KSB1 bacterium]
MVTINKPWGALFAAAILWVGYGPWNAGGEHEALQNKRTASGTVGTVKSADGVEIRYETSGQNEPALVFVHGWSCDRSYWRAQMDFFSASYRVVAIDLAGHGESGLGRKDWTLAAFGHDVHAVIEALDLRKVVLVGHSMGGPVIVEAAQLMPDRVVALIPVDTFQDVDRRMSVEERDSFLVPMRADFRKATEAVVKQFMFTARSDTALIGRVARDMAASPPLVGISAMEHLFNYDEAAALAAVKAPMHLINADLWPTNLEAARRRKPEVALTVMPGVGHFLMMEEPEEFNRLLARAVRLVMSGQK